ncbi:RNA exonuclease Rex3 [Penicillium hispanicum]|uniref:RNA exonuclease Rex3 n=1 Tax=Penicillium hispanicum TaxID=1080232 RepID=UPI0025421815|nr:RNA exonuclease Rex3 [Penicillium hispanicum]KAJ5594755.1 RNA exonuclease Rex3 [Penicillium hispanicum]
MFTTLGLFADVPCPQGQQCSLLTCMFSHAAQSRSAADTPGITTALPSKRTKLENSTPSSRESLGPGQIQPHEIAAHVSTEPPGSTGLPHVVNRDVSSLLSATRRVSPPPGRPGSKSAETGSPSSTTTAPASQGSSQLPPRKAPKESLNPRMLPKSPASHSVRSAILNKLHAAMTTLNEQLVKDKDRSKKSFVLTRDELVTMALDEEEKVAKESPGVYSNIIKLRIVKLTKMSPEEWTKEVIAHLNSRYYKIEPIQPASANTPKSIDAGLTPREEIALVTKLTTPLNGLEEFGYVTKVPSDAEVETARKGAAQSKGWEKCDRCGGRFQVFPGRREDGALASGGQCTYHPSRPIYPPRRRTDRITGSSEAYFPCCSESVGASSGCTKANTHVFKVSETKRLASILQFKTTPVQPDKGHLDPVCFDCEMGYTTFGLELIRLTAVSWPEGRELLDVLVKPMGEILDLNSRYSGVFPEHYVSATPYGTPISHDKPPLQGKDTDQTKALQFVDSPAMARDLLLELLQPDTPLIGHAIDNDLNVCRVIHPTVIDTVLLYPHPRGRLPNRMSLKALARKFLERDIQTGGDRGHDSREDSIATGDLVSVKVGELWKRLKAKGWRFEGDQLIPPPGQTSQDLQRTMQELGPGGGHKRKNSNIA